MFHLLLVLLPLGITVLLIVILAVPLCFGPILQAVFTVFSERKLLLWLPGVLGLLGFAVSVYYYCIRETVLDLGIVLLYWAFYGLLLLAAYLVSKTVKKWVVQWIGSLR